MYGPVCPLARQHNGCAVSPEFRDARHEIRNGICVGETELLRLTSNLRKMK
jgi:hypothetical protein